MAVEPLYIAKSLLLQRLRMSNTSDTETLTTIDQAIADVRLEFYRRLTLDRATEIAALPSIENPTTTQGVLRGVAEVTELYWVMYKLICILPTMFIETAHAITNSFKDVPITRDSESLQKFLGCLKNTIEINLGQLIIPVNDNAGDFQAFSTGRPTPFILADNVIGRPISRAGL
jgi:hypothetical protein